MVGRPAAYGASLLNKPSLSEPPGASVAETASVTLNEVVLDHSSDSALVLAAAGASVSVGIGVVARNHVYAQFVSSVDSVHASL